MSFLSNLRFKIESVLFSLLVLFLPTQLGKHFWPDFAVVSGIRIDYLSPTVYVTDIFAVLLFILWLVRMLKTSAAAFILKSKPSNLFIGFLLFIIFTIVVSHNIFNGLYHVAKFLEFSFVAYYVAQKVTKSNQLTNVFSLLAIGVITQSLLSILQFLLQSSVGGIFYFFGERNFTAATPGIANASLSGELVLRAYGTFPHPNVLAGFLLIVMTGLLFGIGLVRNRVEKMLWVTALLLGSSALLLTMSRIAIVLWIGFLVIIFLQQKKNWLVAASVTAVVVGIGIFLSTPFGSRLLQTNLAEEAVVQRVDLIQASVQMFMRQPVIGVGFGNFLPTLASLDQATSLGFFLQPVHNIFLLVFAELGIVGLGFFVGFLGRTYQQVLRLIKSAKASTFIYRIFLVSLTTILILGSLDHYFLTLQQGQLLFAFVLGFCWTRLSNK